LASGLRFSFYNADVATFFFSAIFPADGRRDLVRHRLGSGWLLRASDETAAYRSISIDYDHSPGIFARNYRGNGSS